MPARKPLVIIDGQLQELPASDTLNAPVSAVDVITKTNGGATAITVGMPVYVKSDGNVDKASAAAGGTKAVIGLVRDASIAAAATGNIQTDGTLTSTDWTSVAGSATLTAGAAYYLSATAGQITATAPTTSGHYVARIGIATATDTLEIDTERGGVLLA
jgi:hypothetical protein